MDIGSTVVAILFSQLLSSLFPLLLRCLDGSGSRAEGRDQRGEDMKRKPRGGEMNVFEVHG